MRWLTYEPAVHGSVRSFCSYYPPSRVFPHRTPSQVAGISLESKRPLWHRDSDELDGAIEAASHLRQNFELQPGGSREGAEAVLKQIHEVASDVGCAVGKWMLFLDEQAADEAWSQIAQATYDGSLGSSSTKIGRTQYQDRFLICVYHHNYEDEASIGQLLEKLRRLDIDPAYTQDISFKADIMTYCGIYSGWYPGADLCCWRSRYGPCSWQPL